MKSLFILVSLLVCSSSLVYADCSYLGRTYSTGTKLGQATCLQNGSWQGQLPEQPSQGQSVPRPQLPGQSSQGQSPQQPQMQGESQGQSVPRPQLPGQPQTPGQSSQGQPVPRPQLPGQ